MFLDKPVDKTTRSTQSLTNASICRSNEWFGAGCTRLILILLETFAVNIELVIIFQSYFIVRSFLRPDITQFPGNMLLSMYDVDIFINPFVNGEVSKHNH